MLMLFLQEAVPAPDVVLAGAAAIQAVIPVVVPFIVWGVRKVLPKIPRVALPMIAVGLGMGLDWLLAYTSGGTFSPLVGAALGGAGVALREIVNTLQEHGAKS